MDDWGFLENYRYLIRDRNTKFTDSSSTIIKSSRVAPLKLPARSSNLNALAERWVRPVKEETLSKLILIGKASLQRLLGEYLTHSLYERYQQGKGNVLLFPSSQVPTACRKQTVCCRELWGDYWDTTTGRPQEFFGYMRM